MVHIKKKKKFKNSRYYSYPHYTDVEIEHREVKGLSQSLRLSRCWSHDSNPDRAALGFHHHSPGHTICFLHSRHLLFSSLPVPQRVLSACVFGRALFAYRIPHCWHLLIISI